MTKILALVLVLLVSAQAITDKEILQQGLNGFFEENKLPQPTTIVPCLDDDTAHRLVVFISESLGKGAGGSIADLVSLLNSIKPFLDTIPQPVQECLDGNKEAEALGIKYGITNTTDPNTLIKKLVTYITLHYLQVHKWLVDSNSTWGNGKYYETGFNGAGYFHIILGSSVEIPNLTNKEILQQGLNGLFEQNKLADPTTIVPCIDEDTAGKIVRFIGEVLEKAAKGSISDLLALKKIIQDFGDQIPKSVKDCLDGNAEFEALGKKYGITNTTDTSALEKKIIAYVTLHYLEVHKTLGELNSNWKAAKYYQTGFAGAAFGHKVLGSSVETPKYFDVAIQVAAYARRILDLSIHQISNLRKE
jgi:hypothetical protein